MTAAGRSHRGVYAGVIGHIRPTRDDNLLIHESGTNRIIPVMLDPPRRSRRHFFAGPLCGPVQPPDLTGS